MQIGHGGNYSVRDSLVTQLKMGDWSGAGHNLFIHIYSHTQGMSHNSTLPPCNVKKALCTQVTEHVNVH